FRKAPVRPAVAGPEANREDQVAMRSFLVWAAVFTCSSLTGVPARAVEPDWLSQVFPERIHEFGTVARGSRLHCSFPIINRADFQARILRWKTKCGCPTVRVGSKVIPPGPQTQVEAPLDTTRFDRQKASGVTLFLDRPAIIEVDLNMNCFIRSDITMTPGVFD